MITESQITGSVARELRQQLGISQKAFWNPLGVTQSVSSRYEASVAEIPKPVRILLVANYVAGVKIDAATSEGLEELSRLGSIQSKRSQAKAVAGSARSDLSKAIKSLEAARDALQSM